MKTWQEIESVYAAHLHNPNTARQASSMLGLIRRLRRHPELAVIYHSVGAVLHDGLEELLIWWPGANSILHIGCTVEDRFVIYKDHQGPTPDTYFGDRQTADATQIIPLIEDALRGS